MIDPIPSEPFTVGVQGTDTYEVSDPETARADLFALVSGVMDIRPQQQGEALANAQLHKIWIRTKSVAYTQWITEQAMNVIAFEMLHVAETWEIPSRLRHVNALILAWRVIRPVTHDPGISPLNESLPERSN